MSLQKNDDGSESYWLELPDGTKYELFRYGERVDMKDPELKQKFGIGFHKGPDNQIIEREGISWYRPGETLPIKTKYVVREKLDQLVTIRVKLPNRPRIECQAKLVNLGYTVLGGEAPIPSEHHARFVITESLDLARVFGGLDRSGEEDDPMRPGFKRLVVTPEQRESSLMDSFGTTVNRRDINFICAGEITLITKNNGHGDSTMIEAYIREVSWEEV